MLYLEHNGDVVYKTYSKKVVLDHISPQILIDRMEQAGYHRIFAVMSVTGKINLKDLSKTIELGKAVGLLQ